MILGLSLGLMTIEASECNSKSHSVSDITMTLPLLGMSIGGLILLKK